MKEIAKETKRKTVTDYICRVTNVTAISGKPSASRFCDCCAVFSCNYWDCWDWDYCAGSSIELGIPFDRFPLLCQKWEVFAFLQCYGGSRMTKQRSTSAIITVRTGMDSYTFYLISRYFFLFLAFILSSSCREVFTLSSIFVITVFVHGCLWLLESLEKRVARRRTSPRETSISFQKSDEIKVLGSRKDEDKVKLVCWGNTSQGISTKKNCRDKKSMKTTKRREMNKPCFRKEGIDV